MNLSEILSVLWHRKWVVVGVTALAIGGAIVALKLVTPVYEATSTMALEPNNLGNDLAFFQTVDAIRARKERAHDLEERHDDDRDRF